MNLNQLAREITLREGGKVNLSIAQVKEVLRIIGDIAAEQNFDDRVGIGLLVIKEKRNKSLYSRRKAL